MVRLQVGVRVWMRLRLRHRLRLRLRLRLILMLRLGETWNPLHVLAPLQVRELSVDRLEGG